MRIAALFLPILLLAPAAHGEFLTEAKRTELMEKLTRLQEASQRQTDGRFQSAIRAYEQAMSSNEAALDLYLKCIEKVRFTDQRKEPKEFRDWKEQNEASYTDPGFKLALRYQLKWLMLSLEAASEKPDVERLTAEASKMLTTIYGDIDKVNHQSATLKQSVLSTVFAQAYGVNKIKSDWPASPIELNTIYEKVILPPLRRPSRLADLNAAWDRRIQLEALDAIEWSNGKNNGGSRKDREKEREIREQQRDDHALREEKFQTETRPLLLWKKQLDLYASGDELGAANRMIEHIGTYANHSSCQEWLEQLQKLLSPQAPAAQP